MSRLPLEREIETVFVHHVHASLEQTSVIGRQVQLPLGIVDLLLLQRSGPYFTPVVAELKRDIIDAAACGQVIGYMGQVSYIINDAILDTFGINSPAYERLTERSYVTGLLIGRRVTKKAYRIIASHNLAFIRYEVDKHGLITFSDRMDSYLRFRLPMKNFTPSEPLQIAIGAVANTVKRELLAEVEEYRMTPGVPERVERGVDHIPGVNPDESVVDWQRRSGEQEHGVKQ